MTRDLDGRFTSRPAAPEMPLHQALAIYNDYFAAICRYQNIAVDAAQRQLARPGECNFDPEWTRASYARQLAMYLTNTQDGVKQRTVAAIAGVSPAAACSAFREIENLRDHRAYEALIETVVLEVKARRLSRGRAVPDPASAKECCR